VEPLERARSDGDVLTVKFTP
jgi:hypothetical protein